MSISILPPEILGEVFVQTQIGSLDIPFLENNQLTLLNQVCRHWWMVVSTTPTLWTRLSIRFTDPLRLTKLIEVATWCLSRSRELPVALKADVFSARTALAPMSDDVVRRLVRPNARRWHELDLLVAPHSLSLLVEPALPVAAFPNLRDLKIRFTSAPLDPAPYGYLSTCLARSPLLTQIKLARFHVNPTNVWNFRYPWRQMAHIDLSYSKVSVECCYDILQQCHELEKFLVYVSSDPGHGAPNPSHAQPIILPYLHSLSIRSSIGYIISTFLTPFVTPNLRFFHFDFSRSNEGISDIGFQALQTRSNFRLERLNLEGEIARPAFHDILTRCPSLLTLRITGAWCLLDNDDVTTGRVIPKLEHLFIAWYVRSSELRRVVDARTKPGYPSPLKSFRVSAYTEGVLREEYAEFIARGLEFEFIPIGGLPIFA